MTTTKRHNAMVDKTPMDSWSEAEDGAALVQWLNHPNVAAPARQRIENIIGLLAKSRKTTDEEKKLAIWRDGILVALKRYRSQNPYFTEWQFGFRPKIGPTVTIQIRGHKGSYAEGHALTSIQRLQQAGRDSRLRRCAICTRWIYVRFPSREKYCSKRCRERSFKSGPEFKAKRRVWMRDYQRRRRRKQKEEHEQFLKMLQRQKPKRKKQRQPQRKTQPKRRKA